VCCLEATFFRHITHRLGVLDSGINYTNYTSNTAHVYTNTTHKLLYVHLLFFTKFFITHIDHLRIEKCRYRRKVAMEFPVLRLFS
jgi:hypothetical protein